MTKYQISLNYLDTWNKQNIDSHICAYSMIEEFKNLKEAKQYAIYEIKSWINNNKKWYDQACKQFDSIDRKINIEKNDLNKWIFYFAEKTGYLQDFGIQKIIEVIITPITKKNAIYFVKRGYE